mgnify:CR=1 FL=1
MNYYVLGGTNSGLTNRKLFLYKSIIPNLNKSVFLNLVLGNENETNLVKLLRDPILIVAVIISFSEYPNLF